jgi:hypothetical protein
MRCCLRVKYLPTCGPSMWHLLNGQTVRRRLAYSTLTSVSLSVQDSSRLVTKLNRCGKGKGKGNV